MSVSDFFPAGPELGWTSMAETSMSETKGHGIFPLTAVLTCSTDLLIMVVKLDFLKDRNGRNKGKYAAFGVKYASG